MSSSNFGCNAEFISQPFSVRYGSQSSLASFCPGKVKYSSNALGLVPFPRLSNKPKKCWGRCDSWPKPPGSKYAEDASGSLSTDDLYQESRGEATRRMGWAPWRSGHASPLNRFCHHVHRRAARHLMHEVLASSHGGRSNIRRCLTRRGTWIRRM